MDWKSAVLILIWTVCRQVVDGELQVTASNGRVISATIGDEVAMTCVVQDLGSAKLNWVFVKQSLTIFHGLDLKVIGNKYSLQHPESSVYTLLISSVTALDQGVYKCEVDGTSTAAIFELNITDSSVPAEVAVPTLPLNSTGCCLQQGVSEGCLALCAPREHDVDMMDLASCAGELDHYIYCGSDGRNHENCCARKGIPSECLVLCNNDPLQIPTVSTACLTYFHIILSCYEYGAAVIPSPPERVSAVLDGVRQNELWISWRKPLYNPLNVTGYIVFYKKDLESKFTASHRLEPSSLQYQLSVELNAAYSVYVVAVGHHGSSQPSAIIDIPTIQIPSSGGADVDICCGVRGVSQECQDELCVPQLWQTFNTNALFQCGEFLHDVFACLADERDHTACCAVNHVPDVCLPMCSGSPPPFNQSLSLCVPKLPIISACVQQGLRTQPAAPTGVTLGSVTAHTASVSWTDPTSLGMAAVDIYHIQLRRGNELALWTSVMEVEGTAVELTNLTESENYAVRMMAEVGNTSSLPSAAIRFRTLPETTPPIRPTVAHNLTECCEESGMPAECSAGCEYMPNMTAYYAMHLDVCKWHIGTVLTCAADGRNHKPCCQQKGVQEICYGMCVLNAPGPLNPQYIACLNDTSTIVGCFEEGLDDHVRMPEDVMVTNYTSHTITLQWSNPETGPAPEKYEVHYTVGDLQTVKTTTGHVMVLQNLRPKTPYTLRVASVLNGSSSPPTQAIQVITTDTGVESPFVPTLPSNISRALWSNRSHCCQNSNIRAECQSLCLNQPSTAADCSMENQKILACSTEGQDHSACCREEGLVEECVSLCGGHTFPNFTLLQAGCLAQSSLNIITSCFLSNTGLLPTVPGAFTVENRDRSVRLRWTEAENCGNGCSYDVHYWRASTTDPNDYTTVMGVTSPFDLTGLDVGGKFTFTVTARVSKGSGPAAPWQTLFFGIMSPDIFIAQRPGVLGNVYDQGQDVTLICEVINTPHRMSYTWYHRGQALVGSRDRVLLLDNVHRFLEGNYTCEVAIQDFVLTASVYVNVRYQPELTNHLVESTSPNVGAEAVVEFVFRGHPLTNATVWTRDGNPLQPSARYSFSSQTFPQHGMTAMKMKIADVVQTDFGTYSCRASNQFGFHVAVIDLMDPDEITPTIPPSPGQKKNMTECCQAHQVHELCMPVCSMDVSVEEAVDKPEQYGFCLLYFDDLINCAADGGDHTLCCERQQVAADCLPFCRGRVPPTEDITSTPHLLKCVPESTKILQCMETGYDKIPTAPQNVSVQFEGNTLIVTWFKPRRNADRVTSYTIYYNYTGHAQAAAETIIGAAKFRHALQKVEGGHTYNIWMTAENQEVGRSQASAMLIIDMEAGTTEADGNEKQTGLSEGEVAGVVVGVLLVVIAVSVLVVYLVRRNGSGKLKLVESVGFENASYDNAAVQIKNLPGSYDKF